jgi:hypothetical protein
MFAAHGFDSISDQVASHFGKIDCSNAFFTGLIGKKKKAKLRPI